MYKMKNCKSTGVIFMLGNCKSVWFVRVSQVCLQKFLSVIQFYPIFRTYVCFIWQDEPLYEEPSTNYEPVPEEVLPVPVSSISLSRAYQGPH